MKILLLEDEMILKESIKEFLEDLGHFVIDVSNGMLALNLILQESFDILILDINVPKVDGFSILQTIRDNNIFTPTIYISALIDIDDITKAFNIGCSDYIKKPFHLKELALRVNNISKMVKERNKNHILISKSYSFYNGTLYFLGEPVELSKTHSQILEIMVKNIGLVVDFERFRDFVWNSDNIDNPTIRAEINRLKKNLKEDFIKNIRGFGYKIDKI